LDLHEEKAELEHIEGKTYIDNGDNSLKTIKTIDYGHVFSNDYNAKSSRAQELFRQ
jgi:hypothetical protein